MVSRFGINECTKIFQNYVLDLGGYCQAMIRGLRLKDGEWLNDTIINAFGKLLNDHCDDKILFFGTHF